MRKNFDIIHGNPRQCLFAMVLPMMAAMFLNMAYNLVDSLWIGNLLGESAYAALTAATPILLLLNSIAMGATNGVAILLSQAIGAGETRRTRTILFTSFILSIVFSLGMTGLLEGMVSPLLRFLQVPSELYEMTCLYLRIYLIGYGAVYLYCYFAAVLRSFGDTVFQMLAMLVCTVLNGALDPLLIHGFGLQGAAAATVLSQGICLGFMVCYLRKKALFSFHAADWSGKEFGAVCLKSLPEAFQQSIPAISTSVLTAIVSGFGVTALAAYGVAGKLELLLFYPAMSFQMVLTTIVGQCIGAGRCDRAWVYCKTALLWGGGLLIILSCGVVGLAHPLSELFVDSKAVAEVVAGYFQVVSVGYLFNMETNCFLGAVNGMGHPRRSMLCMVLYYLIIRIPLACLLSSAGLNGIWAAVLCSHVAAVVTACLLARGLASRKKSPI